MKFLKVIPGALVLAAALVITGTFSTPSQALVVVEESNGVTIVRNVKVFSSRNSTDAAGARGVRPSTFIGSTDIFKPERSLSDAEIEECNRRLRRPGNAGLVVIDGVRWCQ
ncbi:MAG: hypothetical protein AAGE61_14170 [Pseudomonadota bacterium]